MYLGLSRSASNWKRSEPAPHVPAYLEAVNIESESGQITGDIGSTESFVINIVVRVTQTTPLMQVPLRITNQEGIPILTSSNCDRERKLLSLEPGCHHFRVHVPANFLPGGAYNLGVWTHVPRIVLYDGVETVMFRVEDTGSVANAVGDGRYGVVATELDWERIEGPGLKVTETEVPRPIAYR